MKKFLSMALAATMIMSMASVALADAELKNPGIYEDSLKTGWIATNTANYGDSVYVIFSNAPVVDQKDAKDLKVTAKWDTNGDYVESVQWEKKMVKIGNNIEGRYVIAINLKEQPTSTKTKDIIGTLTVKDSSKNFHFEGNAKEMKIEVALTASNPLAPNLDATGDDTYVYKFKDTAEEEEHELSLYADVGKFVVNTIGQGKLVIKTDVKYNKGIENVAPDVNYTYFNGNNATFNRLGDLYLNAKEGEFLYKVNADGTLTKVDAKYDSDEEAFVVRTRVIGSYVISEKELDVEKVNAGVKAPEETTAPTAPTAPSNPTTGAAC